MPVGIKVRQKHQGQVCDYIEILQKSDFLDQLVNFFYLLKLLSKVFAELKPLSGVQLPKGEITKPFRIEKLCKFLEEHFKEDISLDEIAEKANLKPHAFCRYFKNCTGKTFVAYLNELRIREACKLLGLGRHDSISLIAYDSGFNSITNFNRCSGISWVFRPKYTSATTEITYTINGLFNRFRLFDPHLAEGAQFPTRFQL